ncbi:DUF2867 domain-containing protein [Enterovibrio calviensis]|uniref:DUF2867 domain-containing protein n=1 Tax=Enterovibrio calviensis TaxID=91359 RepID=UPI0004836D52|nr:DUF2867 domain-containing protein [Enterovibrio calviensis]
MQPVTGKVLVVGATGYIGHHLVSALLKPQHNVVATSRRFSRLQNQAWSSHPQLETRQVDLHNGDGLSHALDGVSTIYYLAHGMASGSDFYQYELDMAHHMASALSNSNVDRVIYLGATQPEGVSSTHLAARKATGNILRDSGKQIIEIRAGIVIGSGSAAFEVMRDIVSHLPIITAPATIQSQSRPIALETMIGYLMAAMSMPMEGSATFDASGPEVISYEDQMRRFARIIDKRVAIFKVPFLTPKMATRWLSIVTTVPKPIAQSLIHGLDYDLLPTGTDLSTQVSLPHISFEHAVESALANESDVVKNDIWGFDAEALARWHKGYGYYPKQAGFSVNTDATAHDLWQKIRHVGGDEGYFFGDSLWTLRAYMDAAVGGNALKKRRPDPESLKAGDYIDSWKVLRCEKNQHLSLLFGMKAPGLGRLEFTIVDHGEHRTLDIRAWWHPAGFLGLLYWFAMMPAHLFIFRGMAFSLAKKSGAKVITPSHR